MVKTLAFNQTKYKQTRCQTAESGGVQLSLIGGEIISKTVATFHWLRLQERNVMVECFLSTCSRGSVRCGYKLMKVHCNVL